MHQTISTPDAPGAIGVYSQAVRVGDFVYISGQIPLDPKTMTLVEGGFEAQVEQVFKNLQAVAFAAGGDLAAIVKMTIYLTSMDNYQKLNEHMERLMAPPFPARAVVGVSQLPRGALVEMDSILITSADAGRIL